MKQKLMLSAGMQPDFMFYPSQQIIPKVISLLVTDPIRQALVHNAGPGH